MTKPENLKPVENQYENPNQDLKELDQVIQFNKAEVIRAGEKTENKKVGGDMLGLGKSEIKIDKTPIEEAKAYKEVAKQQIEIAKQAQLMNEQTDKMYLESMNALDREDLQNQMQINAQLNQLQPFDQA